MKLLRRAAYAGLGLALVAGGGLTGLFFTVFAPTSTLGRIDFDRPLRIPPIAQSHVTEGGIRVFDLTARKGTTALLPGKPTGTWGFNSSYLGPTLRAARGEKVRVKVHNDLDETTTVHWHGMHVPARFDGGPHQPIDPGQTWTPQWQIDQPAATLWYHPHPEGHTAEHINRGLAGMFILDDPDNPVTDRLPHRYGVDDIPVIVQDKRLTGDGHLRPSGLGENILVNGTYGPYQKVTTQKVRLRLLNASDLRVYNFGLSGDQAFQMIASGGGLLPKPVTTDRVQLAPGERAEIVVSMSPDENAVLRSYPPDLGVNFIGARLAGGQDQFAVLQLRATHRLRASPRVPATLAPTPSLDVSHAKTRTFDMQYRQINGTSMDMTHVDEIVQVGTTEIWKVTNTGGNYHDFHVHDVQFEVLTIDGHEPGAQLSGWKDTIFMPPGRTARIAMRFTDYADPDSPYMYHCHLLAHEDAGMMGQFAVVSHGQTASTDSNMPNADH